MGTFRRLKSNYLGESPKVVFATDNILDKASFGPVILSYDIDTKAHREIRPSNDVLAGEQALVNNSECHLRKMPFMLN